MKENAISIIKKLNEHGFEAYMVGGCVRNECMELPPKDYDLTTSATPDQIINVFHDYRIIPTGIKH
jgi:tRNA nucleotidyltransferase (CCA-adding enzyme)